MDNTTTVQAVYVYSEAQKRSDKKFREKNKERLNIQQNIYYNINKERIAIRRKELHAAKSPEIKELLKAKQRLAYQRRKLAKAAAIV